MRSVAIRSVVLLVSAFASGCGQTQDVSTVVYKAPFDTSQIEGVEKIVDDVASKWKLRVFRKDRRELSLVTQGHDAFFVALYLGRDPIVFLTNAGVGTVLTLGINDYGTLSVENQVRLANDLVFPLREYLNIDLRLSEDT
ncbi:MAG: hypothetical protein WD793_00590 [Steroidobacteraceae bacterium]